MKSSRLLLLGLLAFTALAVSTAANAQTPQPTQTQSPAPTQQPTPTPTPPSSTGGATFPNCVQGYKGPVGPGANLGAAQTACNALDAAWDTYCKAVHGQTFRGDCSADRTSQVTCDDARTRSGRVACSCSCIAPLPVLAALVGGRTQDDAIGAFCSASLDNETICTEALSEILAE